jgi:hypothetical protein
MTGVGNSAVAAVTFNFSASGVGVREESRRYAEVRSNGKNLIFPKPGGK